VASSPEDQALASHRILVRLSLSLSLLTCCSIWEILESLLSQEQSGYVTESYLHSNCTSTHASGGAVSTEGSGTGLPIRPPLIRREMMSVSNLLVYPVPPPHCPLSSLSVSEERAQDEGGDPLLSERHRILERMAALELEYGQLRDRLSSLGAGETPPP
jgi:hypothetical protein